MSRNLAISQIHGVKEETVTDAVADFLSPKVAHLYRWWHAHAQAGRLPLRREFDIADHVQIVPDLFLVEVLPNGEFLMKLEGERVIELFGVSNVGRTIAASSGVREWGHALAEYYQSIVEERLCRRCLGRVEQVNERRWIEFESIDCPLSRDSTQVDFILGVSVSLREKSF